METLKNFIKSIPKRILTIAIICLIIIGIGWYYTNNVNYDDSTTVRNEQQKEFQNLVSQYNQLKEQLIVWETVYQELTNSNQTSQNLLTQQQSQITTLQSQLDTSEKSLQQANLNLINLQLQMKKLEDSFNSYVKHTKRTERRLKRQKITTGIVAGLFGYEVGKHI